MCGIVGIVARSGDIVPNLMDGLRRLEYRGYDSAGIAAIRDGHLETRRAKGRIRNLEARLASEPLSAPVGIGHIRWATHGAPDERNAHPQSDGRVAVAHNGIIENYLSLREKTTADGAVFTSDTDTEVVAHLITYHLKRGLDPDGAVLAAIRELEGAFALAILIADAPDRLYAARKGNPLAIGVGDAGAMYLGSDAMTLAPSTQRIVYLEDGDWACLRADSFEIRDLSGAPVQRVEQISSVSGAMIGKGGYRHFMLKEIYEQPQVIGDTLSAFLNPQARTLSLPDLPFDLSQVQRVQILGCGTSYYAGLVARNWIEQVARVPVDIDVASEFRYRAPPLTPGGLAIFISQSGETADTLAAMRHCKEAGVWCVAVVNAPESTMAREAHAVLNTLAGPEIGVASTKAFTTQLVVLAALCLVLGREKGVLSDEQVAEYAEALAEVPARAADVLGHDARTRDLAAGLVEARDVLYMGRGPSHAIAMEGALKLKEISYIHAEGYPAGELKHGPIALIDETVPVVVVAPGDALFDKTFSNVREVLARGGRIILLTDERGVAQAEGLAGVELIVLPGIHAFTAPILYAIPVQLLAYHIAVLKGTDVDQPRNLAKSVTVE
ncbi:glutamine--fructose-6-phosphate transaminase (isomerizing) [Phaeovibrio sulfidiphilus]|uniref:Glutamine--fructose-6-phosphate aminotransferase [isomerizing] n=1 Tax=Phaeovibrio sulfidiphilus TaxID=1220600 RepID=A0A8J6YYV6_9PROT|nr:glutamine--fructose-6-phosphate transaminase (isomerizing) [Phaeovibrio sulfidiphilus]MBE1237058.1 glutamine--fructose-6-phosphate transaminase (isomerizing) [Phaeovibrio sulfidiphilus]